MKWKRIGWKMDSKKLTLVTCFNFFLQSFFTFFCFFSLSLLSSVSSNKISGRMNSQGNTTPQVTTLLMNVESKGERGRGREGVVCIKVWKRKECDAMKMNEKRERVCLTVGCFGSSSSWNENFSWGLKYAVNERMDRERERKRKREKWKEREWKRGKAFRL